ncbi:MAG TPA: NADH-quinone oxidoreductase subunit C [Herpetosiphonaceae bacterium]
MALDNATVRARVLDRFGSAVLDTSEYRGDLAFRLRPEALREVAAFLRDDPNLQYVLLASVTGVDYLGREPRFEVVYHLRSFVNAHLVVLKVGADEEHPHVPSLVPLWPTANYQEREAYDMFGIIFDDHPDLQRILLPEDWDGHPQRKDQPLVYEEVAFTFNHDAVDAQKPYARE